MPADQRSAWLADEIPCDIKLRERLLAAAASRHEASNDAEAIQFVWSSSSLNDPLIGQRLGPFEIQARLNDQGGMGTVYRGQRVDGLFEQDVAIKVIARGRDTDAL